MFIKRIAQTQVQEGTFSQPRAEEPTRNVGVVRINEAHQFNAEHSGHKHANEQNRCILTENCGITRKGQLKISQKSAKMQFLRHKIQKNSQRNK